jgi:transposase-like protein
MTHGDPMIDETATKMIAAEVAESLRDELQALTARFVRADAKPSMTVSKVAAHLGVTRSTVYAHWREWGGYKLGSGGKAPIRFEASKLPSHVSEDHNGRDGRAPEPGRRRRVLIADAPRMPKALEEIA